MERYCLFSILVANYNNGCFLSEAIESVKAQTYPLWEVIIVDDASTDNSIEVYKHYAEDNRIKIYYNEKNQGCGYSKRRCIELASGELCAFLDPDDALTFDALDIMEQEHRKRPNVALICSRQIFCDKNLKRLRDSEIRDKSKLNYLTDRLHAVEAFATFKKQMYVKSSGINSKLKRAVDQDLFYLLEEQGDIIFIDNLLYNYRLHVDNLSIGHYKALYWQVLALQSAAERRGLDPEIIVGKHFSQMFKRYDQRYETLLHSPYYRLGYYVFYLFSYIKKKLIGKNT